MRGLPTKSAVTPLRIAIARTPVPLASCRTTVPALSGRNVFLTTTGIPRATAGRIVAGWRTLAPKNASSAASAEAHFGHEARLGHEPGIGGEDAVHVRPDLDGAHLAARVLQRRAEERGRVVRSAAPEGRRRAAHGRAHEAARHDDAPGRQLREDARRDAARRLGLVGQRGTVRRVRREDLARIDPHGLGAARAERGGDESRGHELAHAQERIRGPRRDFFE